MTLKYYKQDNSVPDLNFATEQSACFDLSAFLKNGEKVEGKASSGMDIRLVVKNQELLIYPLDRIMIPTGIILDIPENHCVKIYPRSSVAYKRGLTLVNNVGIIDSDYVHPLYLLMINLSERPVIVKNGERLCQAELVPVYKTEFESLFVAPEQKTSRSGGIGSTGV